MSTFQPETLRRLALEAEERTAALTRDLIRLPSPSGEEGALARRLSEEMTSRGFDEVFTDPMGNVVGLVRGREPGPVIMFNGHMDQVDPGNPSNWEGYDPYGGEMDECAADSRDGQTREPVRCIHGRGASDMKAGLAALVAAGGILAREKGRGAALPGTYLVSAVVQEEPAETVGMSYLLDTTLPARALVPAVTVIAEATSLGLYLGHRGRLELEVKTLGRTSHGSRPDAGINAVYKALPLIAAIRDELAPSLPSDPHLGKATIALTRISCKPGALSIIPDECAFSLDRRALPGEALEEIVREIEAIIRRLGSRDPDFRAAVSPVEAAERSYTGMESRCLKYMRPWKVPMDHPVVRAAAEGLAGLGRPVEYGYWVFATDGSKSAGECRIPTIGYSPMQEQYAHTPRDLVRVDFLTEAVAGYLAMFDKLALLAAQGGSLRL